MCRDIEKIDEGVFSYDEMLFLFVHKYLAPPSGSNKNLQQFVKLNKMKETETRNAIVKGMNLAKKQVQAIIKELCFDVFSVLQQVKEW